MLFRSILLSPEFLELWSKIKQKTAYRVSIDTEQLVKNCVKALQEMPHIPKTRLVSQTADIHIQQSGISHMEREMRTMEIANDYQALPDIITAIVAAIPQIIEGIITAVLNSIPQIIETGVTLFISLIENLPTIIIELVKAVPQIISSLVRAFTESIPRIVEVGANLVRGLWQGIQSLASWLWDKVSGWISSIWDGICDFFGIASPSKEMGWVGEMLVQGLAGAIDANGKDAVKSAEHMADNINGVMQGLAADMSAALPQKIDVAASLTGVGAVPQGQQAQAFNVTIPLTIDGSTLARILAEIQWTQNAVYVRNLGTI